MCLCKSSYEWRSDGQKQCEANEMQKGKQQQTKWKKNQEWYNRSANMLLVWTSYTYCVVLPFYFCVYVLLKRATHHRLPFIVCLCFACSIYGKSVVCHCKNLFCHTLSMRSIHRCVSAITIDNDSDKYLAFSIVAHSAARIYAGTISALEMRRI